MRWTLLLASGCVLVNADTALVQSTGGAPAGTDPGQRVEAHSCTAWLFGAVPFTMANGDRDGPRRQRDESAYLLGRITSDGAVTVVSVTIDQRSFAGPFGIVRCVRMEGRRVSSG